MPFDSLVVGHFCDFTIVLVRERFWVKPKEDDQQLARSLKLYEQEEL